MKNFEFWSIIKKFKKSIEQDSEEFFDRAEYEAA